VRVEFIYEFSFCSHKFCFYCYDKNDERLDEIFRVYRRVEYIMSIMWNRIKKKVTISLSLFHVIDCNIILYVFNRFRISYLTVLYIFYIMYTNRYTECSDERSKAR